MLKKRRRKEGGIKVSFLPMTTAYRIKLGRITLTDFPTYEAIKMQRSEIIIKLIKLFRMIGLGTTKKINAAIGSDETDDRIEFFMRREGLPLSIDEATSAENVKETEAMLEKALKVSEYPEKKYDISVNAICRKFQKVPPHELQQIIKELIMEQDHPEGTAEPSKPKKGHGGGRARLPKGPRESDKKLEAAQYKTPELNFKPEQAQDKVAADPESELTREDGGAVILESDRAVAAEAERIAKEAEDQPEDNRVETAESEASPTAFVEPEEEPKDTPEVELDKAQTSEGTEADPMSEEVKVTAAHTDSTTATLQEYIDEVNKLVVGCPIVANHDYDVVKKDTEYLRTLVNYFSQVKYGLIVEYLFDNKVTKETFAQCVRMKTHITRPKGGVRPVDEKAATINKAAFIRWAGEKNWQEYLEYALSEGHIRRSKDEETPRPNVPAEPEVKASDTEGQLSDGANVYKPRGKTFSHPRPRPRKGLEDFLRAEAVKPNPAREPNHAITNLSPTNTTKKTVKGTFIVSVLKSRGQIDEIMDFILKKRDSGVTLDLFMVEEEE